MWAGVNWSATVLWPWGLATIRIAFAGVDPFAAMLVGSVAVGLLAWPISPLMLRLKGDEFSMGMWVLASIRQLAVKLDPMIQGETGSSRISLNAYDADLRGSLIYWAALAAMTLLLGALFVPLHSRKGWPFRQSATAKRRPPRLASNRTGPSASCSCWRRLASQLQGEAPAVTHVNFTGSTKVGRIIGSLAGEALKLVLGDY